MATRTETDVVNAAGRRPGHRARHVPGGERDLHRARASTDLSSTRTARCSSRRPSPRSPRSLLGAGLARRVGTRRVYLIGLAANLVAMSLLVVSSLFTSDEAVAYALLLLATTSLGIGFGFTVPALNTFTAAFNPDPGRLVGAGAQRPARTRHRAGAVFVAVFVGLGFWWGLPVLTAVLLVGLLARERPLPLRTGAARRAAATRDPRARAIPSRFWLYAVFAVLYGVCETMNGNWAPLDMKQLGASTTMASLALTAFWASVTVGRVLFAAIRLRFPTRRHLPPAALRARRRVRRRSRRCPRGDRRRRARRSALAGLGCSALLPLTISFGQEELVVMSAPSPALVSPATRSATAWPRSAPARSRRRDRPLGPVRLGAPVAAVAMGVLAFVIARRRAEPRQPVPPAAGLAITHPRPDRKEHTMSLNGKVAIVTGGNSGIGKAIVLALAEQDANIVIDFVANPEATEELEQQIVALGDQAIGVDADVSKVADLQRLVDTTVKDVRPVDIMVNNAGVETRTSVLDTTEEQYEKVLDDQPQERVLRDPDRGEADDQPGRRRSHHQHHVGPRGLADARQHRVLPVEGRHAHADPHRRRRARAARHPRRRRRPGRGRDADQRVDDERPREDEDARRRDPARPHGEAEGDRQRRRLPRRRRRQLPHRHDDLRRRRHHALEPRPVTRPGAGHE